MSNLQKFAHYLVTRWVWGPRCPEYVAGCPCCNHWEEHDWLFDNKPPKNWKIKSEEQEPLELKVVDNYVVFVDNDDDEVVSLIDELRATRNVRIFLSVNLARSDIDWIDTPDAQSRTLIVPRYKCRVFAQGFVLKHAKCVFSEKFASRCEELGQNSLLLQLQAHDKRNRLKGVG
jgi:hypothetical protein